MERDRQRSLPGAGLEDVVVAVQQRDDTIDEGCDDGCKQLVTSPTLESSTSSALNCRSYSSNCPRKLKLGEMEDRFDLT
jgi:hypothetical protein